MAQLTTFSRALITIAIVGGIFLLAKKFLPQLKSVAGDNTEANVKANDDHSAGGDTYNPNQHNTTTTTTNSGGGTREPFNYTAPAPVNGKLKGVVELGATGFNSFIIRVDSRKNWKLEKAEYGASLVYEKLATDDDIRQGLKRYIADMLAFGVGGGDIHFVISSGAKKIEVTDKIIKTLAGMKYVVNTVTAEQEGRLGLLSCLPAAYKGNGFVVDIGSGNTKISYMRGSAIQAVESYGAKYFQNGVNDATAASDVAGKAKTVPASNRETCFIIGGIPFELAKQVRNGKERFTVLKAPSDYKADGEKQKAGLNLYKSIADATGCKQFVFDWDANFTIGFLLDM